jgi:hypothetical protein
MKMCKLNDGMSIFVNGVNCLLNLFRVMVLPGMHLSIQAEYPFEVDGFTLKGVLHFGC